MLHTGVEANAYGNSKNEGETVQILAVDPPLSVSICDNRYEPYVPCVLLRKDACLTSLERIHGQEGQVPSESEPSELLEHTVTSILQRILFNMVT